MMESKFDVKCGAVGGVGRGLMGGSFVSLDFPSHLHQRCELKCTMIANPPPTMWNLSKEKKESKTMTSSQA